MYMYNHENSLEFKYMYICILLYTLGISCIIDLEMMLNRVFLSFLDKCHMIDYI